MGRSASTTTLLAVVLLATVLTASGIAASEHDDTVRAGHPIVGSWIVDIAPDDPTNEPNLNWFTADGVTVDHTPLSTGLGSWVPTGDRTADVTILYREVDEEAGFVGWFTVRASLEVAEDGQSWSGMATLEFPLQEGGTTGQLGPAPVGGERINVEPMGEPVGPLE